MNARYRAKHYRVPVTTQPRSNSTCSPPYGRIPWHRMSAAEQVSMRAELSDILKPEDALCEMCRSAARHAKANAGAAQ